MRSTFKVLFYLKRTKSSPHSIYPVMGRITVNGTMCQFSAKLNVPEKLWEVKGGRAKGKSVESTRINSHLDNIRVQIGKHYQDICDYDGYVTAEKVRNAYLGLGRKYRTLLEVYAQFIEDISKRVGVDRSPSSYKQYRRSRSLVGAFMRKEYKVSDMPLIELEASFIEKFHVYLCHDCGFVRTGPSTPVLNLKYIVKQAFYNGWVPRDPFAGFQIKIPQTERTHLTEDELAMLLTKKLKSRNRELARDMFVFSCFTGICYADLRSLEWKQIAQDEHGDWWITGHRNKTGTKFIVKLLPVPLALIRRYKGLSGSERVLPMPSISVLNRLLKKIMEEVGIDKNISFHCGRHTFATTIALKNGVPLSTLKTMLGHKHINTTEVYAKTTAPLIDDAIAQIRSKLAERFSV